MSTQQEPLPTCDPLLNPIVASRSNIFTPRRAVDSSGRLGSFYDACYDQVLPNLNFNFVKKTLRSQQQPQCGIDTCKPGKSSNLLEWYNMHHELRLSVALQMVQEMGVGALMNYSRPIDKYTRFICYTYYDYTDYLSDEQFRSLSRSRPLMPNTLATHIIVLVNWGIDAVAVLQLPPNDEILEKIDYAINKLCISLSNNQANIVLSQNDERLLEQIVHTQVFSNIPDLCKINSIVGFSHEIPRVKNNINLINPYNYSLCPIQYFYAVNNGTQGIFCNLTEEGAIIIEGYLLQLSDSFKRLRTVINQDYPNLQRLLKNQFSEMRARWTDLEQMHTREIQRLHDLVVDVRRGEIDQKLISGILNNGKRNKVTKYIEDFDSDLKIMKEKAHLIDTLIQKGFEYRSANDHDVKHGDNKQVIENKLMVDKNRERIICSDDNLYKKNRTQWDNLHCQLLKERKENPHLQLIYVDFTDCSYELKNFITLPMKDSSSHVNKPKAVSTSISERAKNDGVTNILLLGESGVGKSTFINAFVNYLLFDTLEQAQNKPVVIIPVSFVMTVGDDFEERTVTFGGTDVVSNEDHDHPGQSVTQHCKSYVFTLKDGVNQGRKLRIIDTPGIGDVRGLAQDDINMQHILSYINNLTHLNAVCILMKPNNTRLTIFFRSCFMQLFDLLGENARDKILFCFTNSRSTFYTPGNTGPLVKELLKSLPIENILFTKNNTFCFDSESFRYLVAVQDGVKFMKSEENDYRDSWNKSVSESKRFLEHICTKMSTFLVTVERESMKDAQLKINLMIRPILEAMRNILRNIVLWNPEARTKLIELYPENIIHPTTACLTCPREFHEYGGFWISTDALHVLQDKCRTYEGSPADRYPIDYKLEYKLCNYATNASCEDFVKMVHDLCQTSAEFAHFLVEITDSSRNDLFLAGIKRMIKEEDVICKTKTPCQRNLALLNRLKQLKKDYEQVRKTLSAKKEHIQLQDIYDKIQQMGKYPMIGSQMAAAKEWHKYMIKYYEYEVPT